MTERAPPDRAGRRRAAAALLAACGLIACSGDGTRVYDVRVFATYQPSEFRGAGTYPLVVFGAPPDGSSAEEVAAAMRLPEHMGGTELVVAPPGAQGRRFVIAFIEGTPDWACKWTGVPEDGLRPSLCGRSSPGAGTPT